MVEIYTCIFDTKKVCSVRQEFKLVPESLVEFCQICDKTMRSSGDHEAQMVFQGIASMSSLQMQQQQNMFQQFMVMQQSTLCVITDMVKAIIDQKDKTDK